MFTKDTVFYTGIGARKTPDDVLVLMRKIARKLSENNLVVRSGGAKGADTAFEEGARDRVEIFAPWNGFNGKQQEYRILPEAYRMAENYHPVWNYLSCAEKTLMARNIHELLGPNLDHPSEFVICYTLDGCYRHKQRTRKTGGTGLAISAADDFNIPVFNLNNKTHLQFVTKVLIKD